ncbi:PE family protein [Mycobacterium intermedium]|uniref:PE family protein n=1 Tax=Mycobacterium intermedium TaxID=28445 RepID=A0A1E3SLQ0_MYCIE|nr:PE-PPE domain-containing protein [Mycobacterium intermedium]MCV6962847.1 PE-PPE domain-containing protein [Mycobacterium intermedium]ODR02573.1 PE family protein [Mycobacterium intermedium]OPE50365.1 PE family protein [Mycobacterium intermedium]ORB09940.1 PE family protein [Mycobacterium intermedium]
MSYLIAAPELLASAATDVQGIAAAVNAANAAAATRTSGLAAAAADEVSGLAAAFFNAYAQEYQAVVKQAGLFESQFTQALANASNAYAQAEAANAARVSTALNSINAPIQAFLNGAAAPAAVPGGGGAVALGAPPQSLSLVGDITALIMGGTNNPKPSSGYINDINTRFIQTLFPGAIPKGLFTPEQFWPVTPDLGNMTYNQSVAKGVQLLSQAVTAELALDHSVAVFGYSQSASIINNYINSLAAAGFPNPNDLAFVMVAAGNNPVGGLLARFPGFYIPFLDVSFNGGTLANTPYETHIYTLQYDGIGHTPQYPLNVLADINAIMGYFFVHGGVPDLTAADLANAVPLPTSPGYAGNTSYYMLLTQDLPLLQPIRNIPFAGPVIADVFQPVLRVMVDLGYSDYGPTGMYADISTPAALLNIPNPLTVGYYLLTGSLLGPYGAAVEVGVQAGLWGPEHFPDVYPWVPSTNPGLNINLGQQQVTLLSLLSGGLGNALHIIPSIDW